eukprot:953787-Amorphochlora_amoeboformis.AAC.3
MATESLIGGEFSTSPPTFTNNSGSKLANLLGLPRDSKVPTHPHGFLVKLLKSVSPIRQH